jgi:putative transposase
MSREPRGPIGERRERTAQGYRRFRCRNYGKQFNERTGGPVNRARYHPGGCVFVIDVRLHLWDAVLVAE